MNLQFRSFADAGELSKERIVFKALADMDIGDFAVIRSGVGSGRDFPTSGRKIAYWFPDENVKANDLVVLYSKEGRRSSKRLEDGSTAYFFYWNRESPLWDDAQFGVVLLQVSDWEFHVPALTEAQPKRAGADAF